MMADSLYGSISSRSSAGKFGRVSVMNAAISMKNLLLFLFIGVLLPHLSVGQDGDSEISRSCYDSLGRAQRCMPDFINAAFGDVQIEATNTCGVTQVTEYCLQTGVTGARKSCHYCDANTPGLNHPAEFLTDFNKNQNLTWWQSETMLEGIQYPVGVNITLNMKKAFDVTYVRLRFYSPKPESFAIYKKTSDDSPWVPYQFYSASCTSTYGLPFRAIITPENEATAICTDEYSDISPLTGGNIPFSTLDGRPSSHEFENSPVLQEWVTATQIKIVLTRMNTFGDEVFGDPQVLKSYFYAISDLAVGARCKCNGHAKDCVLHEADGDRRLICDCKHNTMGDNCEQCLPFFNDKPWARATEREAHECQACDCNGLADGCYFDRDLYERTGRGGHCIDCRDNTDGAYCERCKDYHYRRAQDNYCTQCSEDLQCDDMVNVDVNLEPCGCVEAGSVGNNAWCNPVDGKCDCKENVEGRNCDRCKPGYFGLDARNPYGCVSCFCYGQSSDCASATGYYATSITTDFSTGPQRWKAADRAGTNIETQYNGILGNLGVSSLSQEPVYFLAPARYLGDQRFSYNRFLTFDLRIGEDDSRASVLDIVIEGEGQRISSAIFTQGVGFIDNIQLETARIGSTGSDQATWIEQCTCPDGYVGQFCESCAAGYKRDPPFGGPFSKCVPCECHGHSENCEPRSGRCICQHNTEGDFCERCISGYYGNARNGSANDCQPCPCPNGGPCVQLNNGDVVCTECPEGSGGNTCDFCIDGYYGNPAADSPVPCQRCSCNENVDPNAVGNCDRITGECLKCIYNTAGFYCEKCLPSYYGDALAVPKGDCQACNCYPPGTLSAGVLTCDPVTGQCPCLTHVEGRQCDRCRTGYWNLDSGTGCEDCLCNSMGSLNRTCDVIYGQCQCKPGVTGRSCDKCMLYHYGFSNTGCDACNCDPLGSLNLQCDNNGHCPCHNSAEGRRCDRCVENKYNLTAGCVDCPPCYSLVQQRVNVHRGKLRDLKNLIINIGNNPAAFNDTDFKEHMNKVNDSVMMLLDEARGAISDNGTLTKQLADMKKTIQDVMIKTGTITRNIKSADEASKASMSDIEKAHEAIDRAERALQSAETYIDTEGRAALQRAQEALKKFGQQSKQMTEIATRAKQEADRQMEQAKRIEMLANNALNTYSDASRLYNQTKLLAADARKRAVDAYQESLKLYTEVTSLPLPSLDVPILLQNSREIKLEASQIKDEADRIMKENADLLNDVTNQKINAEDLLADGVRQQQRVDELLAEVDVARSMARDAVEKAEKTLLEANQTLQTLLDFDKQVQQSKDKADEALRKIPEIEGQIEDAEKKTGEAQASLSGAESDADMALKLAQQAQSTAQNASNEASRIRQDAEKNKQRATSLKDEADVLASDLADSENKITNLTNQAMKDEELTEEALQKANGAKITAQDISDKVKMALETVENMARVLGQLPSVDMARLDQLERDLNTTEEQLQNADLDRQYRDLERADDDIVQLVSDYEYQYNQLKEDVDNIRQIKDSLPDGCFKNIEIESAPGQ
ncbi:hypothetical protein KUTeg_022419 [Tegillarca granosa]|uniref:Laminin subunit gamma-1 n=1 Tax=Tegillarca granosa TaxID=220873 RepID=A0ABQ9EBR5_TEGGR|nr:hypothetical protein KUTeg_022419 [Tegillarca granosa]